MHGAYLTGRTAAQMVLNEASREIVLDCEEDDVDLSAYIQGVCLE